METKRQWDLGPPILMHFTPTHLLVLSDEGTYRLYDMSNPQEFSQYTLGTEVSELGIVSAKGYDDGFVVLTGGLQFLEVRGWKGGRVGALAPAGKSIVYLQRWTHHDEFGKVLTCMCILGLTTPPHSWTIIPPDQSTSGHVEILVSSDSSILTIDALERIDQRISRGPFSHILLSPNGRFLALVTITGLLWVVSSDFARSMSEVDISDMGGEIEGQGGGGIPDQAEWCGDNAVVLSWKGRVVVVGPNGDALRCIHVIGRNVG